MRLGGGRRGYSITELMIAALILGILVLMVIPRGGEMLRKSKERRTRNYLGVIRSALLVYYNTHTNLLPATLDVLTVNNRYLLGVNNRFPVAHAPPHHDESSVINSCSPADSGWWGYYSSYDRKVVVCCTHTDSNGTVWTNY